MKKINYTNSVLNKMQEIVDNCMGDEQAFCIAACPMHTDVKKYVSLIGEEKHKEALKIIREKVFLPGTLGRICAHPCEEACRRNEEFGRPISVAALKRYVADKEDNADDWDLTKKENTGKNIAIIGAGPAGAQAAIDLTREGHNVTIYDKLNVFGGMMRVGIPEYRLPRNIIDFEYSYLEKLGVEFRMGVEIGKDIPFEKLTEDYDAVLIAVGAHKGRKIPITGHDLEGSYHAVEYLKEISLTHKFNGVGKRVAVIGGGDVAMDCARSSFRVGAEEVHLVCLEEGEVMPASKFEIEESKEEGVIFHDGFGPRSIVDKNGHVGGLEIVKVKSIFDDEGKFNPQYNEDLKEILHVDTVIFAVGQAVDNDFTEDMLETKAGGRYVINPETLQTNMENVFVAGDACGTVIVIEAMASGRKASNSIDRYLRQVDLTVARDFHMEAACTSNLEIPLPEGTIDLPRYSTNMKNPESRKYTFEECDNGFTDEEAIKEASRCLKCQCKLCMNECEMLNDYCECPKELFENIIKNDDVDPMIPFSCNMCSSCTIVCPQEFKIKDSFMDMRKEMVKANNGKSPIKGHKAIDMHQLLGFSKFFNITRKSKNKKENDKGRA